MVEAFPVVSEVLTHKTSLTSTFFIKVSASSLESKRLSICVLVVSILTSFLEFLFWILELKVWYILGFFILLSNMCNLIFQIHFTGRNA